MMCIGCKKTHPQFKPNFLVSTVSFLKISSYEIVKKLVYAICVVSANVRTKVALALSACFQQHKQTRFDGADLRTLNRNIMKGKY